MIINYTIVSNMLVKFYTVVFQKNKEEKAQSAQVLISMV